MLKIKQKTKNRIFASTLLFSMLFLQTFPFGVQAGIPSPNSIANAIKSKIMNPSALAQLMGIPVVQIQQAGALISKIEKLSSSVDSVTDQAKQNNTLNAGDNQIQGTTYKVDYPSVNVTFNADSVDSTGASAKVTASAVPSFFKDGSDPKKLYFIWYLKRKECRLTSETHLDLTSSENKAIKDKCDLDFNNKITENDWKIAASKIIVAGAKSSETASSIGSGPDASVDANATLLSQDEQNKIYKDSGHLAIPEIFKQADGQDVGWKNGIRRNEQGNLFEENENSDNVQNCYIREPKTGLNYELRKTTASVDVGGTVCPPGTSLACIASDQQQTCEVMNSAFDQITKDETDVIFNLFTADPVAWRADPANAGKPDPVAYAISPTKMLETPKFCGITSSDSGGACKIETALDLKNYKGTVSCDKDRITGKPQKAVCLKTTEDDGVTPINTLLPTGDYSTVFTPAIREGDALYSAPDEYGDITQILNDDGTPKVAASNIAWSSVFAPGVVSGPTAVIFGKNNLCSAFEKQPTISQTTPLDILSPVFSSIKTNGVIGQSCEAPAIVAATSAASGTCSFSKKENLCKHLFPVLPKTVKTDGEYDVTGDGKFNLAEKQFWGADPKKTSTNGVQKDEEAITGLGVDKFTWILSKDDQVGVVVEGESAFPTEHADSTYKRTWAFSKDTCNAMNFDGDSMTDSRVTRGVYLEGPGGAECNPLDRSRCIGFLTANFDLNQCLKENLLDPDIDGNSKLKVQLTSSPVNPVNDVLGSGDILNISSTPLNTENSGGLEYKWSVQISKDREGTPTNTTGWIDITNDMLNRTKSISAADIEGVDKKDFAIDLNMPITGSDVISSFMTGKAFFLRVKVKIKGTAADGSQNAEGSVVVRIGNQLNRIKAFPVAADRDGMLTMNTANEGAACDAKTCYVTKNQLVGLKVFSSDPLHPNIDQTKSFSWTINGNASSCTSTISEQCDKNSSTFEHGILFFPVLGDEGEAVDVTAKSIGKNNEVIEVTKHFVISAAGLNITTSNALSDENGLCVEDCLDNINDNGGVCPKQMGYYNDVVDPNKQYLDCATGVWETNEGQIVVFRGGEGFSWEVDGQNVPSDPNGNLALPISKKVGESYNIALSTDMSQENVINTNNKRKALLKNWNIVPEESITGDETQVASIQLDVVPSRVPVVSSAKASFFGASLITHLPAQLLFLFKISVSSMLLFFMTGLLFAFIPESLFKREEK